MGFTVNNLHNSEFFAENISENLRGKAISLTDMYGRQANTRLTDARIHDANFAFLTTELAKLHKTLYEPKYFVTWQDDIPYETGGGFVDYVEYYTADWAGIMNAHRNIVGNSVNVVPRVNAGLNQSRAKVYTFEVAYDLPFIELEKMKKLTLQKSIKEIYNNAIVAGWDLFVQSVAYTGITDAGTSSTGLFNSDDKVVTTTIDNSSTTGKGFEGITDEAVVSFFNGIFESYLSNTNMNPNLIPDTILVPSFVASDLVNRFSALYSNNLYEYIIAHNLGSTTGRKVDLTIAMRPDLDKMNEGKGRIVAYRKHKDFVRIDLPYPIQHYITLPDIQRFAYTTAFVGQVSEIQMPYNTSSEEFGVVTYWDFTN